MLHDFVCVGWGWGGGLIIFVKYKINISIVMVKAKDSHRTQQILSYSIIDLKVRDLFSVSC